jgi:hypothetical protein
MYRFGDGTPFPLRENFIETLVAAVDCCVALYQVEARIEEHEARVHEVRRRATEELRRLDALFGLIETALAPLAAHKDQRGRASVSEQAAARIYEGATTIIRNSRTSVTRKRETAEQEVVPPSVRDAVPVALGQFFAHHQLPHTRWQAHWRASGHEPASADLVAHATRGLEIEFRASPPPDSFWSRPIPMSELLKEEVTALVEGEKGRTRPVRIDPMVLTEVQVAPGREAMVLRESIKRPSGGLHVVLARPGEMGPLAVQLDKRDQNRGQPFYLDEASAGAIKGAWRALERELPSLVACRDEMAGAELGGHDVAELEHPAQLAETILLAMAPLVREMRMRSRVPGELILKRDLTVDRREEMFVPREALWNKLAELSPRHRQLFEAIGLSNEATTEFINRAASKAGRARAPVGTGPEHVIPPPELPTLESYGFERDPDLIDSRRPRAGSTGVRSAAPEPPTGEDGVSEVEVTSPRSEQTEVSVVSGIIEHASA